MSNRLTEAVRTRRAMRRSAWGALYDDERGDVPGWAAVA
jgi:hypothetical protein